IERTISIFSVLHTQVTCAPSALAICTAKVPTPPEAPMSSTSCPGRTFPWSRKACRAVEPMMATTAACSKVRFAGLGASLSSRAHVLGVGALPDTEYLIARLEPAHILADGLHDPGHVRADDGVVGRAEAVAREAYRVRQTRHDVPDVPTHASRMHANQYLIVGDLGDVDVPEFQDLGGPVGVPDHCLHRVLLLSPVEWLHLM